ncbi:hypothetical protein Tco_1003863 [Tanacetum coccineum]|uniref:Uncharacterized protein n=1 Tax=Tanacetum coccineum TaxID=301880 RepID=A0ABQ5FBM6_9ASTR
MLPMLFDSEIEFVKAKQDDKAVRNTIKYAEMYRSQRPRGNQRNWNKQKSQQLGSDFVIIKKDCYVCGSLDHLQQVNTARPKAVVNDVRTNWVNVVKASSLWVWRLVKPNISSITLKRYDYVDARGRYKSVMAWVPKKLYQKLEDSEDELKFNGRIFGIKEAFNEET